MSGKTKMIASSDIANGQQPVVTKRGGVGFGPGAVIQAVPASDTALTLQITNAAPETAPVVEPAAPVEAAPVESPVVEAAAPIDMSIVNNALEALQSAEAIKQKAVEDAIAATKLEMQAQVDQAKAEADAQIARAKSEADAQIEQAAADKEQASKQASEADKLQQSIIELGKLVNKSIEMPMVNATVQANAGPKGYAADFFNALESASVQSHSSPNFGVITQRSGENATKWIRRAKAEGVYDQALTEIEDYFRKEHGMFTNAPGPTTGAANSMPDMFLDVLSQFVRETHNHRNVWWQFVTTIYDASGAPSKTILLPRWNNLGAPTSLADYDLGNYQTYTPIANATGTITDSQNMSETAVAVTIREYGMGKPGVANALPVYIPNFHARYSLAQSITEIVNSKLGQNYYALEDLMCRTPFSQTTRTLYNKKNTVVTAANQITTAGDIGVCTSNYLDAVYGYLDANQVPAFPDGNYVLVMNPHDATTLKQDLGTNYAPVSKEQQEAITAALIAATPGVEIGHVNGYFGNYNGFNIFTSNSSAVGVAGSEGVQNETLGGALGTAVTRDNYAFGPGAVGRGIGMPMEIRPSGVNAYNRGESYIWLSHENTSAVDVDSAIVAIPGQQTRVYKLRFLSQAV
jgi:PBP1b-binding outer membrane lipoprotein LpoB